MTDTSPNPQLLRSLGRLARGLSALFWGLPAALIICTGTLNVEVLRPLGVIPAVAVNALLLYGLWQMDDFRSQERPWRAALDRAKLLGIVNLGLSPFLFFYKQMPSQLLFECSLLLFFISALLFLFNLNVVLKQLGAMLPDETLRQETKQFTVLNRWLLVVWVLFTALTVFLPGYLPPGLTINPRTIFVIVHLITTLQLVLGLAPVAITMALIWKAKEVILDGVFGVR